MQFNQSYNSFNWPTKSTEDAAQAMSELKEKKIELMKPIARAFSTEQGQEALKLLEDMYTNTPSATFYSDAGLNAQWVFYREGQKSVIEAIKSCIKEVYADNVSSRVKE